MRALPAAAAAADRPPAPPQTGRRRTEPSMAERALFNNKCFKIITSRRIERAEFCAHSRRRQAAAGLSQPLVTVPPATAPNEAAACRCYQEAASSAGQLLVVVAKGPLPRASRSTVRRSTVRRPAEKARCHACYGGGTQKRVKKNRVGG